MPDRPNRLLRVVGSADTTNQLQSTAATRAQALLPPASELTGLAGFLTDQYILMRRHRDDTSSGWANRLLRSLRAYNGVYEPEVYNEIRKFGGSEAYSRILTMKCRGASSLLRDIYLGITKPWGVDPPADPKIPPEIIQQITSLIQQEWKGAVKAHLEGMQAVQAHNYATESMTQQALTPGVEPGPSQQPGDTGAQTPAQVQATTPPPPPSPPPIPTADEIADRFDQLKEAARQAAKRNAAKKAKIVEDKIEQYIVQGDMADAIAQFLIDLPIFPYACIKGPVVKIKPSVEWQINPRNPTQKTPIVTNKPLLCWERVSPFDIYWTPGVSDIEDANIIERQRVTRKELNDLLDLPGYDTNAVRAVLADYGRGGLVDNWDQTDAERAILESRENPRFNQSGLIACLGFQGYVQGVLLLQAGMDTSAIADPLRDYFVQAWLIGRYVIKVQMAPSPRKRHQYYVTSFEKIPGTIVGNGLPDIINDITTAANATLRALINNMSISSGPQVNVNADRLADGEDGEDLYPWKRWYTKSDPFGNNTQPAISFFQPQSNAQELLAVYTALSNLADEMSAIPKVATGTPTAGPIGRTASGMSMILQGAAKVLQNVAANIDRDILEPMLQNLLDMVILTDDSGLLNGEEKLKVLGVNVAMEKEAELQKKLMFLQLTANPMDMQIIGPRGRSAVLKDVADSLNMPGADIVPDEEELENQRKQAAAATAGMAVAEQANQMGQAGAQATPGSQAHEQHRRARMGAQAQGAQATPSITPGQASPRLNMSQPMGGAMTGPSTNTPGVGQQ